MPTSKSSLFEFFPDDSPRPCSSPCSSDRQRALVKAMGQEDVAEPLNQMAPDDRTFFLSELPANVTKVGGPMA